MTLKQKQALLAYLDYYYGPLDGMWGDKSQKATEAFQRGYQLTVDGIFGAATEKRILEVVSTGEKPVDDKMSATEDKMSAIADWWKGIRYFTRSEFKCKCGGKYCNGYPVEMDPEELRVVDEIRRRAGVPLRVNSGLRCPGWNADPSVGGAANSLHTTGKAVDLSGSISPEKLRAIAEEVTKEMIPGRGGIGLYRWGIHVDNGAYGRWNG